MRLLNFDSLARKASATIREGEDEPRHDQTTIQIGQLVVRKWTFYRSLPKSWAELSVKKTETGVR
ncbi:hypothetical protein P7H19_21570 [Paenibacillus larvae]|nr:hypothetical protein [Paenibacillus larvae]MDT2238343.1 hypothetical protein [Paenibacillus larvae]